MNRRNFLKGLAGIVSGLSLDSGSLAQQTFQTQSQTEEKYYNARDFVSNSSSYNVILENPEQGYCKPIEAIPQNCNVFCFKQTDNPSDKIVHCPMASAKENGEKRTYSLKSILNSNESYDFFADMPSRSSESGRIWTHLGTIESGETKIRFIENNLHTCY